jgi:hypothetical protein
MRQVIANILHTMDQVIDRWLNIFPLRNLQYAPYYRAVDDAVPRLIVPIERRTSHLQGKRDVGRQAKRMPMLFSPTIGAAITAGYWFLRARCPACRTTGDVDLRTLDWHRSAAVTALTPALSCRSCRSNVPFAELVCLSKASLAEEYYAERSDNRWVSE